MYFCCTNYFGYGQLKKEGRSIPDLIFSMEMFEKHLIQLSKKSKVIISTYAHLCHA